MSTQHKRPITLRYIAKRLNVSHVTVSLALRNSPRVSQECRTRVVRTAKELGYRSDPLMTQLASYRKHSIHTKTQSVIAWINDWENPQHFFAQSEFSNYFEGAKSMGERLGYDIEIFNTKELDLKEESLGDVFSSRGIRGMIVPPHPSLYKIADEYLDEMAIIRIGFNSPSSKRHIVCSDQFEGGRIAAQAMILAGYERIGYVSDRAKEIRSRHNFAAGFSTYCNYLSNKNSRVPALIFDSNDPVNGREIYRQWLEKYKVDAVFVSNGRVGDWTREFGLKFGSDIGMAGSSVWDAEYDSGLDQRPFEIGEVAMQLLTRCIERNEFGVPKVPQRLLVLPTWVEGPDLSTKS
ncbi:LacI family transcriptional regulator [Puniceicoccaceae bacterium K14]|nr:LacI family transcriptional regulator [Puniceicoccaceae bacterium K14]